METTGVSKTISKVEAAKVLQTIKNNYRKAYAGMTPEEIRNLIEIWEKGLQRVEAQYVWQALNWYIYESTDSFPPTIGQFLSKAHEYKVKYEQKHPTIRNAWEVRDES